MQRPTHHPQEVLRGANRMRSAAPSSKRLQVRIFLLGISAALEIGESERVTGLWGLCQEALMLQNLSFTLVKIQHFSGIVSLTLVQSSNPFHTFAHFCIVLRCFLSWRSSSEPRTKGPANSRTSGDPMKSQPPWLGLNSLGSNADKARLRAGSLKNIFTNFTTFYYILLPCGWGKLFVAPWFPISHENVGNMDTPSSLAPPKRFFPRVSQRVCPNSQPSTCALGKSCKGCMMLKYCTWST